MPTGLCIGADNNQEHGGQNPKRQPPHLQLMWRLPSSVSFITSSYIPRGYSTQLNRISLAVLVGRAAVNLSLLGSPVLEEILGHCREQRIAENILILLLPLCAFLLKLRKLRSNLVCRTAGDRCLVTDDLLLDFRIERFNRLSELAHKDLLGLLWNHLIALAHNNVHNSLCTHNLG